MTKIDNPIVYSFDLPIDLKLPGLSDRRSAEALAAINKFWYGKETIPIPTPEYKNSKEHLEATYKVLRGRTGLLKISIYANGSWKLEPVPFDEEDNEISSNSSS